MKIYSPSKNLGYTLKILYHHEARQMPETIKKEALQLGASACFPYISYVEAVEATELTRVHDVFVDKETRQCFISNNKRRTFS